MLEILTLGLLYMVQQQTFAVLPADDESHLHHARNDGYPRRILQQVFRYGLVRDRHDVPEGKRGIRDPSDLIRLSRQHSRREQQTQRYYGYQE